MFTIEDLISPAYLAEQWLLHDAPRGYGGKGAKWANMVHQLAALHVPIDCILDYGCGQNSLAVALRQRGLKTRSYDPAIHNYASMPKRSDMVTCTDCLEHVEPDKVAAVIDHLAELTGKVLFVVISHVPSNKHLSDGSDAHVSLHDRAWWIAALLRRFDVADDFQAEEYRPHKQIVLLLRPKAAPA